MIFYLKMIWLSVYVENSRIFKILGTNNYSRAAGYRGNIQKPTAFLYTRNEKIGLWNEKLLPFIIILPNQMLT